MKSVKELVRGIKGWLDDKLVGWRKPDLKEIDKAIKELDIKNLPKNPYTKVQSIRRLKNVIQKLSKNKRLVFNPQKPALKKLGIKLPKSNTGLSVDFANTPYLYKAVGNEKAIVKIKMTGDELLDKKLANKLAGLQKKPKDYTWHHLDDYNPITGTCTMQLVKTTIHQACAPHYGGVKIIEDFLGIIYKNR